MSGQVYWVYVVNVKAGAFDDLKSLIQEVVEASRKESGTIDYQFWTADDGLTVNIFEHYRDSAAIVSHVQQTLNPFADRLASLTSIKSVTSTAIPTTPRANPRRLGLRLHGADRRLLTPCLTEAIYTRSAKPTGVRDGTRDPKINDRNL